MIAAAPQSELFKAKALYGFPKESDGDLPFHAGDIISIIETVR